MSQRTWNHRIMASQQTDYVYFQMHEVHYTDGVPTDYTSHAVRIGGDSVEDIKWMIDKMKEATDKPVLWYGDRFPEEYVSDLEPYEKVPDPPSDHGDSKKPT